MVRASKTRPEKPGIMAAHFDRIPHRGPERKNYAMKKITTLLFFTTAFLAASAHAAQPPVSLSPLILAQVPSQVKTGFQYGLGLLFMIGFPYIKAKVEERIKNVPAENRQRAFVRVAKDEAMRQTMRQGQTQAPPSQGIGV
jgi:hypothetical protein